MRVKVRHILFAGLVVLLSMQPSGFMPAQEGQKNQRDLVNEYFIRPEAEPRMSHGDMMEQLRKKVKYVFVIYQENRSFDSYFGTFPGAEGLYSHPAADTPGFTQYLTRYDGRHGPHLALPHRTVRHVPALHGEWRFLAHHLLRAGY